MGQSLRHGHVLPEVLLRTLVADLACRVEDLLGERTTVTAFEARPGRRRFPITPTMLNVVTIGAGTVVCAGPVHEQWAREVLGPMKPQAIFSQPGLVTILQRMSAHGGEAMGPGPSYLCTQATLRTVAAVPGLRMEMLEGKAIEKLYGHQRLHMALSYYTQGDRPDMIAAAAWAGQELAGVAACSADSDEMWQVGIDVMPAWRGRGVGKWLVYEVTRAILDRWKIPYYSCGLYNLASQRIACAAGYWPAWTSLAAR